MNEIEYQNIWSGIPFGIRIQANLYSHTQPNTTAAHKIKIHFLFIHFSIFLFLFSLFQIP